MAQFPLVLAVEPRLLPYAVANGFNMDEKVCDNQKVNSNACSLTNAFSTATSCSEKCLKVRR